MYILQGKKGDAEGMNIVLKPGLLLTCQERLDHFYVNLKKNVQV